MINFALLLTSLLAGVLTVAAPCVLTLLPVIVGGSLVGGNKWRPVIISLSLSLSVLLFTLLLKVFTIFIDVPQMVWTILSGVIILFFGLTLLFPTAWDFISIKLRLSQGSEGLLQKAQAGEGHSVWSAIFLGAALGPVFASCSPTYFVILATVLPVSFTAGLIYLLAYAVGLALILILIGYLGRIITARLKFAANPNGWFKKVLGLLLAIVGVAILAGWDKQVEEYLINNGFGSTSIERDLLKGIDLSDMNKTESAQSDENQIQSSTQQDVAQADNALKKLPWKESNEGVLADFGPAPELVGLENWINSNPTTLAELKGKVVMIDFWTYSCINCIRTLPYLQRWHEQYAKDGLVIIGVHDPEFQFERKLENVQQAVKDRGLTYPVVQDNDRGTWNVYKNRYWPAKYIIDKEGRLRYYHFGEGDYDGTEKVIQKLLEMPAVPLVADQVKAEKGSGGVTAETYLGTDRRETMVLEGQDLALGDWMIGGEWVEEEERVVSGAKEDVHLMRFSASTANLVMGGKGTVRVLVDGKPLIEGAGADVKKGVLTLDRERLYRIVDWKGVQKDTIVELVFDQPGSEIYAWTFG